MRYGVGNYNRRNFVDRIANDTYIRYCFNDGDRLNVWNEWLAKYKKSVTVKIIISLIIIMTAVIPSVFWGEMQNAGFVLLPIILLSIFGVFIFIDEYKTTGTMIEIFHGNIATLPSDSIGYLRKEMNGIFIEQIENNRKYTVWTIPLFILLMLGVIMLTIRSNQAWMGVVFAGIVIMVVISIVMHIKNRRFQDKKNTIASQIDEKLQKAYKEQNI